MGALYTAWKNRSSLLVTVGQQDRRHLFHEPLLAGPLVEMARPVAKAALAVERAEDVSVPRGCRPVGPAFLLT